MRRGQVSNGHPAAPDSAHRRFTGPQRMSRYPDYLVKEHNVRKSPKETSDPAKVFAVSVAQPAFTPTPIGLVDGQQKSQQLPEKH